MKHIPHSLSIAALLCAAGFMIGCGGGVDAGVDAGEPWVPPATCEGTLPDFTPCGGDFLGSWTAQLLCADAPPVELTIPEIPAGVLPDCVSLEGGKLTLVQGSMVIKDDATCDLMPGVPNCLVASTSATSNPTAKLGDECLSHLAVILGGEGSPALPGNLTCMMLGQLLASRQLGSCSYGSGVCTCAQADQAHPQSIMASWTATESSLFLTQAGYPDTTWEYCRRDSYLTIRDPATGAVTRYFKP